MPHNAVATRKPLELEISGKNSSRNNRITFEYGETVRDVSDRIRSQLQLKPNMQIIFNSLEGPHQGQLQGLLSGDRMSKHFPRGGKVRIDTKAQVPSEADFSIQGNKTHQSGKQNNIIAMQAEKDKAAIKENTASDTSKQNNFITNDAKSVIDKFNFD
ncbi:hypothetical protein PFICI_02663 [Pestalotiopsis fici W106-1]|uniref:Uncharacterized protein n=1 Tax=Pestalotiopsis fici (strain W106-1 / CGMCC3.15140) TaxID=1229662 RepID=W3XEW2_PESFW|nr:uncharacterized protein PFICI_02663 [Pestalotiopsis fici W106-1]ETS84638.1 hypothetical protein PFICI_02663 [Pestalotiopsis fici W106-1]